MNEFELFEQLCALESVADEYGGGSSCSVEIDQLQRAIASRLYRVAVIGEFKRGKSSLVNAIIGADVLPTDILPMTAAITRVTYGAERKILIRYKDGQTEEQTVEQLLEYATKYDEEKSRRAASVSEIEVSYPSVFCQNHIDIIDTPGLNDNESMTEVTLSILGDVDAAIVVISASHPLSMTEKQLIVDLIGKRQIRHLVFVVTHIDVVSNRPKEQDKMLQFIRERIAGDVLTMARERYAGNPYFMEKAQQILSEPDLFGVSSVLAMEGFIQDDWELLEQSRFPVFKNELLALLTVAQSTDVVEKIKDMAEMVSAQLESWYQADAASLEAIKTDVLGRIDQFKQYCAALPKTMQERLMQFERTLEEQHLSISALSRNAYASIRKMFIDELGTIREDNNTDEDIRAALNLALSHADAYVDTLNRESLETIIRMVMAITNVYGQQRRDAGFDGKEFAEDLKPLLSMDAPVFCWKPSPIPAIAQFKGVNVIEYIEENIEASVNSFHEGLENYLTAWKQILRHRQEEDLEKQGPLHQLNQLLQETEQKIVYHNLNHQNNVGRIEHIRRQLT